MKTILEQLSRIVDENSAGHLVKKFGGKSLEGGRIIAVNGEKGPQARIIQPGVHILPFVRIINKVEMFPVIVVPEGKYGYLVAKDGGPMKAGQTYATPFDPSIPIRQMIDAEYFLGEGAGQRGPQTSVLTPAIYRLNRYLWDVVFEDATPVPVGHVGVIKSNVKGPIQMNNLIATGEIDTTPIQVSSVTGELKVPLVHVGAVGIWNESLEPGQYYLNKRVYELTPVDTRVQTWVYKGGFTRRTIDLVLNADGSIEQKPSEKPETTPANAADMAILTKVEGWEVPVELRVQVQVDPDDAPFVVAAVGGIEEVENKILTPAIRSVTRNQIGGGSIEVFADDGTTNKVTRRIVVLDLQDNRSAIEDVIEAKIGPEGDKARVSIKDVRFADAAIPPELLVARKREQLAQQQLKAFAEEKKAQDARIATEQARATANMQDKLVEAEIEVERSKQLKEALENEGLGQQAKLEAIAAGQKAQTEVLGEDKVVELRKYEMTLETVMKFLTENPDVLKAGLENAHKFVPERVFNIGGEGGSLNGAAAILGDLMGTSETTKTDK